MLTIMELMLFAYLRGVSLYACLVCGGFSCVVGLGFQQRPDYPTRTSEPKVFCNNPLAQS